MNRLKNLTILALLTLFCTNSCVQNKRVVLNKNVKTEKQKLIKKQHTDSVAKIDAVHLNAGNALQKDNGFKKTKETFRVQETLFISSNQTESNCAGAFFSHNGLFVKYNKKDKEWTLLCEGILGFNYEKGKEYEIVVSIYDIDYGSAGCADDCPQVKYKLEKIVSQKIPK
jgi:hypothetical protein